MATEYKNFSDNNFSKKVVLLRADLDVPMSNGEILDSTKIKNLIPTLQELIKTNAKTIILSSFGEKTGEYSDENSLMQIRFEIGRQLEKSIKFVDLEHCDNSIKFMDFGEVLLIENLFFYKDEFKASSEKQEEFMHKVIQYCDFFVNDAFGVDESLSSIKIPSSKLTSSFGLAFAKNLECLENLKTDLRSPSVFIFGGQATLSKIAAIKNVVGKFNQILIAGEWSAYFLAAKGVGFGALSLDEKLLKKVSEIIKLLETKKIDLVLPVDHIVANNPNAQSGEYSDIQAIPTGKFAFDVGEKTLVMFREIIESAKTIVWYGTIGKFEIEEFNRGTESVGEYIALSASKDCGKLVLGTSTLVALEKLKVKQKRFTCLVPNAEAFLALV